MSSSKRLNGFLIPSRPGSKTPLKRAHVTRKQADRAQHTHSQGRSTTGRIVVSKREVRLGSDSCERKPLRIEMLLDQRGVIRNYRKRKKKHSTHHKQTIGLIRTTPCRRVSQSAATKHQTRPFANEQSITRPRSVRPQPPPQFRFSQA